jgi:hypothetical protein
MEVSFGIAAELSIITLNSEGDFKCAQARILPTAQYNEIVAPIG